MHNRFISRLATLCVALAAPAAFAQANAHANAHIILPLTITETAALNFGDVAPDPTNPGTVTVTPAGTRTATVVTLGSAAAMKAGSFSLHGGFNATYTIALPAAPGITITSGADTMTVDTFTSNPSATGSLDVAGDGVLKVGATLQVPAAQATGAYGGTFTVSVNYN